MGWVQFLFGGRNRDRNQRDQWTPEVVAKNLISPLNRYGTCFPCSGTGSTKLLCHACMGTGQHPGSCYRCRGKGRFERAAKVCFRCQGTGFCLGRECSKCVGTGKFQAASTEICQGCEGTGRHSSTCRRCEGLGNFTKSCKKCEGSGWFQLGSKSKGDAMGRKMKKTVKYTGLWGETITETHWIPESSGCWTVLFVVIVIGFFNRGCS